MIFYWHNFFGKFCSICRAFKWAYLQLRAGIFKAQHQNLWGGTIQAFKCLEIEKWKRVILQVSSAASFEYSLSQGLSVTTLTKDSNLKKLMQQLSHAGAYSTHVPAIFWFWESIANVNTSNFTPIIHFTNKLCSRFGIKLCYQNTTLPIRLFFLRIDNSKKNHCFSVFDNLTVW